MKIRLILFIIVIAVSGCSTNDKVAYQSSLSIIPKPVHSAVLKDSFLLTAKAIITVDDDSGKYAADMLQGLLQNYTGYKNEIMSAETDIPLIRLLINRHADERIGDEGYNLIVQPDKILLKANHYTGLFYGIKTLLQLLPVPDTSSSLINRPLKIPCVEVLDYPRFKWRGLMLDVSRHFFTLNEVKRMIDEMARYKFNILHLHLTDDNGWRIEIKSLPELTQTGAWRVARSGWWGVRQPPGDKETATYGGFYTQDQIRELVSYAKSRVINILPEIDVPGHSLAAIASYKYLSCTKQDYKVNPGSKFYGVDDNALCAGNDSTYEFLEKVFAEVAGLFPYPFIHIGGDECFKGFWKNCAVCQKKMQAEGLKNEAELQSYFFKRVNAMLQKKGKRLIGWDEMLEGKLPPDAAIMSWRGAEGAGAAAKQQHTVVAATKDYTYLDYYQGDPAAEKPSFGMLRLKKVYEFEPVPPGVDNRFVLGGQGNLWSEFVPDFSHAEYMLWPRSLALAEILWSPKTKRDWQNFILRVCDQQGYFRRAGINNSLSLYDAIVKVSENKQGKIEVQLDTEVDSLKIYYTFSDVDPGIHTLEYKKGDTLIFPTEATSLRVVTYRDKQQVGKIITLPLYELQRRIKEQSQP